MIARQAEVNDPRHQSDDDRHASNSRDQLMPSQRSMVPDERQEPRDQNHGWKQEHKVLDRERPNSRLLFPVPGIRFGVQHGFPLWWVRKTKNVQREHQPAQQNHGWNRASVGPDNQTEYREMKRHQSRGIDRP